MKVAVVRNRDRAGVISSLGQASPETYGKKSVTAVVQGLRAGGHEVRVCEGDMAMLPALAEFLPSNVDGQPGGLVFNMAYGVQGECRYTHVPAMLEMAGLPYTGSSPFGHTLALDKVVTKTLIADAGVATPAYRVVGAHGGSLHGLRYPLVVKPRHESTSYGLHLVHDEDQARHAIAAVVTDYHQDALVEEYVDGREVSVGLLGNGTALQCLPAVELDFHGRDGHLLTWDDKYHKAAVEPTKVCPAPVSGGLLAELEELSRATFAAVHCRDYARVDLRIARDGTPYVLEINSMASLGAGSSYVLAAQRAGMDFATVVNRIVDVAHERYFGTSAPVAAPVRIDAPEELTTAGG